MEFYGVPGNSKRSAAGLGPDSSTGSLADRHFGDNLRDVPCSLDEACAALKEQGKQQQAVVRAFCAVCYLCKDKGVLESSAEHRLMPVLQAILKENAGDEELVKAAAASQQPFAVGAMSVTRRKCILSTSSVTFTEAWKTILDTLA